jgi:hypothetical protein
MVKSKQDSFVHRLGHHKRVNVTLYKHSVYVHLNMTNGNKSVTLNQGEFYILARKMDKIKHSVKVLAKQSKRKVLEKKKKSKSSRTRIESSSDDDSSSSRADESSSHGGSSSENES